MSKTLNLGEFVPVEIAQKLKEKGYPLLRVIKQRGEPIIYDLPKNHPNWQNCNAYYIPTISQVLKWLREEKKIICLPHIEPIEEKWLFYVVKLPQASDFPEHLSSVIYNTYEEATLAGIEYVLDNLI